MIPKAQLTTTQWLSLPVEVRVKLKQIFGIPRSEGTQVMDGKTIVSDGHNHRDLAVITMGKMRAYLGDKSVLPDADFDFVEVFNSLLDKVEEELAPVQVAEVPMNPTGVPSVSIVIDGKQFETKPAEPAKNAPLYPTLKTVQEIPKPEAKPKRKYTRKAKTK